MTATASPLGVRNDRGNSAMRRWVYLMLFIGGCSANPSSDWHINRDLDGTNRVAFAKLGHVSPGNGRVSKSMTKSTLTQHAGWIRRLPSRGGQSTFPNNNNEYPGEGRSDGSYPPEGYPQDYTPPTSTIYSDDPFHETVQDRVDNWRNAQRERYGTLTPEQEANPRDEQGRLKLLVNVSKGSRAMIFFFLMWRVVHLYEVADQTFKGIARLMVVTPLMFLFVANMAGVVASITSPSHSAKKRLKAILNLDKLMEALLLGWCFIRLTVAPSKYIPREIFIANTMHSVFFLIQCQAFTRLSWDETIIRPEKASMTQEEVRDETSYRQEDGNYRRDEVERPQPPQYYTN